MTMEEIKSQVTQIFRDVLDNEEITLYRETTASDVEEWDSLSHINLIVAIEREFNIKFSLIELKGLEDIGDLLDVIESKISG